MEAIPDDLAVSYAPVGILVPYARNARTHSKRQIQQIADSIRVFGFTNPVLVDHRNAIIAGHGRWEAAKVLGLTQIPTIRLEHLTEERKRAYIIADNRLAEKAGWDRSILAIELQHLLAVDADYEITITGFEIPEIDLVIQSAVIEDDAVDDSDLASIDATLPGVTKTGDLWLLGRHRLLCGNALHRSSFETLMTGDLAHLVFTDPPYNVPIHGHVSGNGRIRHREFAMASGEMSEDDFVNFLGSACRLLALNSHSGSIHFICMDWRHAGELLSAGKTAYHELKNICVWVKDNGGMGSFYRSQHELIFVFKHGNAPHRNNVQLGQYGRSRTNVWTYPGANSFSRQNDEGNLLAVHPTVKPVALIADAILDCSAPGDTILDSFLGVGSTLMAAERVGRNCYGLEIDAKYVDATIRRWERNTGGKALHASSGQPFSEPLGREE